MSPHSLRPLVLRASRVTQPCRISTRHPTRSFASSRPCSAKNRIYNSVRNEDEFSSILLSSTSANIPLLTLWTASWCPSCREVAPLIQRLLEEDKVGEEEGGVGYVEVELDSPTIGDLGMRYTITSMPTLLAFSRGEAQMKTRLTSVKDMKNQKFLKEWIEVEARQGGGGGAGGSLFGWFKS